jgi:SCY1-like protein 2
MGNSAISRNVRDIGEHHSATAGHLQGWQIRNGVSIKTSEKVSVWTFDKSDLTKESRKGGAVTDRALQEQFFNIMQKDMKGMQLCPCQGVIQVVEILQEDKTALAFTTEPVVCSLADLLYEFDCVPEGRRLHGGLFEAGGALSEMEISRGLSQLVEGLQVLHNVHRRLHLSLSPEALMITPGGQWKLCSFGYSLCYEHGESARVASPYFLKAVGQHNKTRLEPDLRYCGPEMTIGGIDPPQIRYLTPAADVFAIGVLFLELYRFNLKSLPERRPHLSLVPLSSNSPLDHPNALDSLSNVDMTYLPHALGHLLQTMIALPTHLRINTTDICNHAFFATGNLAVLRAVDGLPSRDAGTQGSQLMALNDQLDDFPTRLLVGAVLPAICQVTSQNAALWTYALPLHRTIYTKLNDKFKFRNVVSESFANGLSVLNPVETMLSFLHCVDFIMEIFDTNFFESHVVNKLLVHCFDKAHSPLQCYLFTVLSRENVYSLVSRNVMLDTIIPNACKIACKNADSDVKVHALYFLSHVLDRMDKPYVAKNILPSLKYITEKDKSPHVTMTVVGLYEALSESLGAEYIAGSILPTIQPFLMDRSLDKEQFTICAKLVQQLTRKVLDQRCSELSLEPSEVTIDLMASIKFDYFAGARKLAEASVKTATAATTKKSLSSNSGARSGGLNLPSCPGGPPPPPSTAAPTSLPSPPSTPAPTLSSNENTFKLAGDASHYRYDPNIAIVGSGTHGTSGSSATSYNSSSTSVPAYSSSTSYNNSSYSSSNIGTSSTAYKPPSSGMAPLKSPSGNKAFQSGSSTTTFSSASAADPFGMSDMGAIFNSTVASNSSSGGGLSLEDQIRNQREQISVAQAKRGVPGNQIQAGMIAPPPAHSSNQGFAFMNQTQPQKTVPTLQPPTGDNFGMSLTGSSNNYNGIQQQQYGQNQLQQQNTNTSGFGFMQQPQGGNSNQMMSNQMPGSMQGGGGMMQGNGMGQLQQQNMGMGLMGLSGQQQSGMNNQMGMKGSSNEDPFAFLS